MKLTLYLAALFVCFSCRNAEYYKNKAMFSEENGDYTMAINYLDQAIAKNPQDVEAYLDRGVDYSILGKYPNAIENYTSVIMLDTLNVLAYFNRSKNYNRLHRYNEAYFDINKAYQITTKYCLGNIYVVMTNDDYAVELAEICLERGVTFYHMDSISQAIADFNFCIAKGIADAYLWRGISYLKIGNNALGCKDLDISYNKGNLEAQKYIQMYCNKN